MGRRVWTAVECDRCNAVEEGPDDHRPPHWLVIRRETLSGISSRWGLLCEQCGNELGEWLDRARPEP